MDSRTRERPASPDAVDFVRYCYRRRRVGWPDLYDEMCAVANRGLYRGWGTDELTAEGIGLSLSELPALAAIVGQVVAEDHERRSPNRPLSGRPRTASEAGARPGDDVGEAGEAELRRLRLAGATA